MTPSKRTAIGWWVGGLIAFAIAIYLHLPLMTESVPGGIGEHQAAPDGATVNAIQEAWKRDGVLNDAKVAMIADLIFIGIYGIGCVLAGLHYRARDQIVLRALGWSALVMGVLFLITDYGETIAQFVQLMRFAGDDDLAALASTLRPVKMFAWIASFLAVGGALIAGRFSSRAA